jgi:putative transposon-encoded protein
MYGPNMSRKVEVIVNGPLNLGEEVVEIYERKVSAYGNGAKVDAQKKYIGYRAYVIIVKD